MRRLLLVSAFFILGATNSAQSADRKMSDAQGAILARALVEAENPEVVKLPGFGFDGDSPDPNFPHLQYFEALSSRQGSMGFYALDLYTGDAWDMTTCKKIKSRKLEQLQRRLRHDIGLSDQRYRQIRVVGPPSATCRR
jgi:hypothetical protein